VNQRRAAKSCSSASSTCFARFCVGEGRASAGGSHLGRSCLLAADACSEEQLPRSDQRAHTHTRTSGVRAAVPASWSVTPYQMPSSHTGRSDREQVPWRCDVHVHSQRGGGSLRFGAQRCIRRMHCVLRCWRRGITAQRASLDQYCQPQRRVSTATVHI